MNEKKCNECKIGFKKMYRIKYKELHYSNKIWLFVCENCLKLVKKNNSFYKYGGTWKK